MPLKSLLIANRGEIACRIIHTARRMGLRTIAVYSDADKNAMHVALADEACCIGAAEAAKSYLNIDAVLDAARQSGAEAIHPGYGFLSERANFAEACENADIIFVGPPPAAIHAMGAKDAAKRLMEKAGVPVVPGYHGDTQDSAFLQRQADAIGYPVLIKAVSGGGGKGMRRVDSSAQFTEALASAQREGRNAFGDPRVLIEKYITSPRHIEIQVFADGHGNCLHLFERDCSLQRRHQKVIEEAPAPGMTTEVRAKMGAAAVAAAKAVGYRGAGTVEFIADASDGLRADRFYFMEMNTRLQVEHPVTEAICGVDLVEWQLKIAGGDVLPMTQAQLAIAGHAVEARLYAEDPSRQFLPSTGQLYRLDWPEQKDGLRVDTGVRAGDKVSPYYDPMIAKVIAHGATRDEAMNKLHAALAKTVVAGPQTNLNFLMRLLSAKAFRDGAFDTGFIDAHLANLTHQPTAESVADIALFALLQKNKRTHAGMSPWDAQDSFQLSSAPALSYTFQIDGETVTSSMPHATDIAITPNPRGVYILNDGHQVFASWPDATEQLKGGVQGNLAAPMNGKVTIVNFKKGDKVVAGDRILVMEAMKMEHAITASKSGIVQDIHVAVGDQVAQGTVLAEIVPEAA